MLGLAFPWLLPAVISAPAPEAILHATRENGAEQCASAERLKKDVSDILRRQVWLADDEAKSRISLDVTFSRGTDSAFVAQVNARGSKSGQRTLRAAEDNCESLSQAVTIAIALLLDSAAALAPRDADGTPASDAQRQARTPDETASDTGPQTSDPSSSAWRARAMLGGGGAYGLGGPGALLGSGGFGVARGRLRLELGVLGTWASSTEYLSGEVRTSLLLGSARGCYLVGQALAIGPCVELGLGRLRGEGSGFDQAQGSSLLWSAGGLGLRAEAALGERFYLALGATLWVPARRQTFSVQNGGIAWESKPVAGALSANVGLELF